MRRSNKRVTQAPDARDAPVTPPPLSSRHTLKGAPPPRAEGASAAEDDVGELSERLARRELLDDDELDRARANMRRHSLPPELGDGGDDALAAGDDERARPAPPPLKPPSGGAVSSAPDGETLPEGWERVPSRSRPGEWSYLNRRTGQAYQEKPTIVATPPNAFL